MIYIKWDYIVAYYEKHLLSIQEQSEQSVDTHSANNYEYFCPMHPSIIRPDNKQKCPVCFMPLSRRKKGENEESLPAGTVSRLQITPYHIIQTGIKTEPVGYQQLFKDIHSVATVEFDERGLKTIAARVTARIDKLIANQTGQLVHKGEDLAILYSSDLYTTLKNLLDAKQSNNQELVQLSRDRLQLWGLDQQQIDDLIKLGKPSYFLKIRAPMDGHITRRYVREGEYVNEGTKICDLADLATVWIEAPLYEEDIAFLPKSSHDPLTGWADRKIPVQASARAYPGRIFEGTISFVYPHIDQETRTLTVRFELKNPEHELRPGMSVDIHLHLGIKELLENKMIKLFKLQDDKILCIPESSVIDTGTIKVVYRQELPGRYDGIKVQLGPKMINSEGMFYFPVISGLNPQDLVVTNGSFLIDAETRLNPALGSQYIGGNNSKNFDSSKTRPSLPEDPDAKANINLAKLSPADRNEAIKQKYCAVRPQTKLGSMAIPIKIVSDKRSFFVCCVSCKEEAEEKFDEIYAKLQTRKSTESSDSLKDSSLEKNQEINNSKIQKELAKLSTSDRTLVLQQLRCPVSNELLGSMGPPIFQKHGQQKIALCCSGCLSSFQEHPEKYLPVKPLEKMKKKSAEELLIEKNLSKLSKTDFALVQEQKLCPSSGQPLGSMGVPIKISLKGKSVFICCDGCRHEVENQPEQTLKKLAEIIKKSKQPNMLNMPEHKDHPPHSKSNGDK